MDQSPSSSTTKIPFSDQNYVTNKKTSGKYTENRLFAQSKKKSVFNITSDVHADGWRHNEQPYSKDKIICSWNDCVDNPFKTCFVCDFGMSGPSSIVYMDVSAPTSSTSSTSSIQFSDQELVLDKSILPDRLKIDKADIPLIEVEDNIFEANSPLKSLKEGKKAIVDRINLASSKSGAITLAKAKGMRDIGSILNGNEDKYCTSPCDNPKWFIIGLTEMVGTM